MPNHLTLRTINTPEELKEHILSAGVQGPSLHPKVNADYRDRWNGWNFTLVVGWDSEGRPFEAKAWHFASGNTDFSHDNLVTGQSILSGQPEWWCKYVTFPLEVAPPIPIVRYPEWTPDRVAVGPV